MAKHLPSSLTIHFLDTHILPEPLPQSAASLSTARTPQLLGILEHLSLLPPPRDTLVNILGGWQRWLRWRAGPDDGGDIGGLRNGRVNRTDEDGGIDEPGNQPQRQPCRRLHSGDEFVVELG